MENHGTKRDLENAHTPTPWMVDGDSIVANDHPFKYVASLSSPRGPERRDADAAFIVRAVNSHEALVKALDAARMQLVTLGGDAREPDADRIQAFILSQIDTALAAARGEA